MKRPIGPLPPPRPGAAPATPVPPPPPPPADAARRRRRRIAWMRAQAVASKTVWSLVVWSLFVLLVLGPLLTVLAFSLTDSVFQGVRPTLHWYRSIFSQRDAYIPLLRSFEVAFLVVVVQLVLGTLVAFATVRRRIAGSQVMDAMSNLTIALPSVVIGLALLSFYGPFGPVHALGEMLFSHPFTLTWTVAIIVFAHVLETFPYMVRTVASVLQQVPANLEPAARSLGASRFTVFRTILLPHLRPALLAGSVLVFSRSIAEFGATIIVVSAVLRTAPIAIYSQEGAGNLELAAAYSVLLMLVSLLVYVLLRRQVQKSGKGLAFT